MFKRGLISRLMLGFLTAGCLAFLASCGTTDAQLKEQGHSQSYIEGFHDGSHSGLEEKGNQFEKYTLDEDRYRSDSDYKAGWLAGELEGVNIQDTANTIGGVAGTAVVGAAVSSDSEPDFDDVAKDAVKHTDTTGFDALGK